MDRKFIGLACLQLGVVALLGSCAATPRAAAPEGGYLGQTPPGSHAELFAPGVVSTPDAVELNGVFSPDFTEFFFTRTTVRPGGGDGESRMYRSVRDSRGVWTEPRHVQVWPADATSLAVDMTYSPDGNRLYFLGKHPHGPSGGEPGYDIWFSDRTAGGEWSLASPVPAPVWTEHAESYPAVIPGGGLQFSSNRPGGLGRSDLWRAAPNAAGGFDVPVNMGPPINSEHPEGDSCASPDGSYVVFQTLRPGGPGNGDLYVSFLNATLGTWSEPVLLGNGINTVDTDYCPMITPDGRFLFFSRRVSDPKDGGWDRVVGGDVYWVSTSVITALRP